MKKYYIIYTICSVAFILSLAAIVLNKDMGLSKHVFGGSKTMVIHPTTAGDIALVALAIFVLAVIVGLIVYGVYRRVHRNK